MCELVWFYPNLPAVTTSACNQNEFDFVKDTKVKIKLKKKHDFLRIMHKLKVVLWHTWEKKILWKSCLRTIFLILLHRWLFIRAEVHLINAIFLDDNAMSFSFEFLGEIKHWAEESGFDMYHSIWNISLHKLFTYIVHLVFTCYDLPCTMLLISFYSLLR